MKFILNNLISFSKATKFVKTIISILAGLKQDRDDTNLMKLAF